MFAERRDPCGYYGFVSLILWSLILLVSIKYVGIVLRADNDGEGGILALLALAFPEKGRKAGVNEATVMTALGVFGAALLYGDGVITPAISVLSAVEGLKTVSPVLDKIIVPLTICILVALFAIQRFGTGAVGGMFGKSNVAVVFVTWRTGKALSRLRRMVFRLMSRNAENAADFFQLPSDRIVEIGFPVEL